MTSTILLAPERRDGRALTAEIEQLRSSALAASAYIAGYRTER
jgi:hypothetical protein